MIGRDFASQNTSLFIIIPPLDKFKTNNNNIMSLEIYFANLLRESTAEHFSIVRDDACSSDVSVQSRRSLSRSPSQKTRKSICRFQSEDSDITLAAPKLPSRKSSFEKLPVNSKWSTESNRIMSELRYPCRNATFNTKA